MPPPPGPLARAWLWVGLGAIPGALLRWLLRCDPLANLLGCLLLGWLAGRRPQQPRLYLLAGVGFCGALTTFGGWVLSVAAALGSQAWGRLALLLAELLLGVGAVALGQRMARPGARLGCWPGGARPGGPWGWGGLRR